MDTTRAWHSGLGVALAEALAAGVVASEAPSRCQTWVSDIHDQRGREVRAGGACIGIVGARNGSFSGKGW